MRDSVSNLKPIYNLQSMRSIEMFVGNPLFGLCAALVLVVVGTKLSTQGEQVILIVAWSLFVLSVFRTSPISKQDWLPRLLVTSAFASIAGLGLCLMTGWRPVLSKFPINLFAMANDGNYPNGTKIGGIAWSTRFVDLRIVLRNETESDYDDLDFTLQPDRPVAEIGQISNLPNVSFSPLADPTYSVVFVEGATKKQTTIPLVLVASDGGYRMRCALLPHKGKLEIVAAVAEIIDFPKPSGAGNPSAALEKHYVIRFGMTENKTQKETGNWYGYGRDATGRIESVRKTSLCRIMSKLMARTPLMGIPRLFHKFST